MGVFGKSVILNREDILKVKDIQIEKVSVPEWGGEVFVKGMTGAERDRFEAGVISFGAKSKEKIDMRDLRAKLCSQTICDEDGKKLFTPADVKELSEKSARKTRLRWIFRALSNPAFLLFCQEQKQGLDFTKPI